MEFYRSIKLGPDRTVESDEYDYEDEGIPAADLLKVEAKEAGD